MVYQKISEDLALFKSKKTNWRKHMRSSMEQLIGSSKNFPSQYFCIHQKITTWALSCKLHPQIRHQKQLSIFLQKERYSPFLILTVQVCSKYVPLGVQDTDLLWPSSISRTAPCKRRSKKSSGMCRSNFQTHGREDNQLSSGMEYLE